ncbi:PD-(D/E)XK nuclease family protein [Spiroplasma endosymbiont of Polydrusus pterygomalis]|uniref:PD-(D/E)XK nuclease family protein n=1 Tax=Spiroplasma endosymbiont of Polydrusus pterygomalis TaxID=3139327 RepID=UPI003CCA893B
MSNLIFKKDIHKYFIDNKELISVSKIIDNYLGSNYSHIAPEILKNAGVRGKWVHKINELYLQNINKENIINNLLIKLKSLTNEINYNYCQKSLIFLQEKFKENNNYEFIIEKSFGYDWIAGTLDLIYFNKQKDKYFIVDYKTYSQLDKFKLEKIKLQLTAYYWLVLKNGYQKLSNIAYIYLINNKEQKEIEIEITKEKLHEWEMALALWKEKWHE